MAGVHTKSDWRPIPLHYGIMTDLDVNIHKIEGSDEKNLQKSRTLSGMKNRRLQVFFEDTLSVGGQLLVFVSSRASAAKEARVLSEFMLKLAKDNCSAISEGDIKKWSSLSKEISIGGEDSSTGSSLAKSAKGGVGFHHAGLTNRQRKAIERSFKNGDIKCIVATPTLAQGVNLPQEGS